MKLTWFGGTTMRIHAGGHIVVTDAEHAPAGAEPAEVRSGADVLVSLDDSAIPSSDLSKWTPRRAGRLIDEGTLPPILLWRGYEESVLVDVVGEPPLFLALDSVYPFGKKWEKDAVVVMFLSATRATHVVLGSVVADIAPRLIVLAGEESEVEIALAVSSSKLDTNFVSLEPGLALEV
jgi:hypothetical protein